MSSKLHGLPLTNTEFAHLEAWLGFAAKYPMPWAGFITHAAEHACHQDAQGVPPDGRLHPATIVTGTHRQSPAPMPRRALHAGPHQTHHPPPSHSPRRHTLSQGPRHCHLRLQVPMVRIPRRHQTRTCPPRAHRPLVAGRTMALCVRYQLCHLPTPAPHEVPSGETPSTPKSPMPHRPHPPRQASHLATGLRHRHL